MFTASQAASHPAARVAESRPRVIQQFTAIFLVSRTGDVWRVYDSESVNGWGRRMPSTNTGDIVTRVFVCVGRANSPRIYRFGPSDDRSLNAERLQMQLDGAGRA